MPQTHLLNSFSRKNVPFDFERLRAPFPKGPFSRENEAQEMTPKLLALLQLCSVHVTIRDVSWVVTFCQSVEVSCSERVNIHFLDKERCARTNIKLGLKAIFGGPQMSCYFISHQKDDGIFWSKRYTFNICRNSWYENGGEFQRGLVIQSFTL